MFRFFILITFILMSLSADASIYNLNNSEAIKTIEVLKGKKGFLTTKYGRSNISYHNIDSVEKVKGFVNKLSGDEIMNLYNKLNQEDDSYYHVMLNGQKLNLTNTYVRDSSNKNKWIRLGSLVLDENVFEDYLNDVYYVYTQREKIPQRIKENTTPLKSNGGVVMVETPEDEAYNRRQQGVVYQPLQRVSLFDN